LDVTWCGQVERYQSFGESCCLHLQGIQICSTQKRHIEISF
jgi:hypothetical protein